MFMMSSHLLLLLLTTVFLLALLIINSNYSEKAFAHETFDYGNFTVTPGWQNEPPLVNQLNSIEISIAEKASGSGGGGGGGEVPVRNAFSNLEASIKSGGLTKTLDLQPQEESAGLYRAQILPTEVGSYSLVLAGKIENQTINSEVPVEDVEDITKFTFPIQEGGGGASQGFQPNQQSSSTGQQQQQQPELQQLSPLISDLIMQINETNNRAMGAEKMAQESVQAIEELKISTDRAYVFGMVAIGLGIGAVILGGLALSRKSEQAISKKR
jgi:hypothetical protein